jgi:hypothetical protein
MRACFASAHGLDPQRPMSVPATNRTSGDGKVSLIFPSGMLGSGFAADPVTRGIALGVDAIAIDAGSTDSGPYYLGAGVSKSPAVALKRDLRILLTAARAAGVPLIVGSCGTSGTNSGVDLTARIVKEIAEEQRLSFTLARIYSEQSKEVIGRALAAGRVHPLPPAGELRQASVEACSHIVGVMGHEPIMAALERGADVVLAGRASDTSLVASFALMHGLPGGPAWHAAKTVECGDMCTSAPRNAGVRVEIDEFGFTVLPLDPRSACTPTSVAAHMLYENVNPFRLREPSGVLDTSKASYQPLDSRTVRVEGSAFYPAELPTIKLEGSSVVGYESMSFVGIADPRVLVEIEAWLEALQSRVEDRVREILGLEPAEYDIALRCYGRDAILGPLAHNGHEPQEVGVLMRVRASSQDTANVIATVANPLLLHLPASGMEHLPSYAFATSPAEIERGPSYEFLLNHYVEVDDATELFRTSIVEVADV